MAIGDRRSPSDGALAAAYCRSWIDGREWEQATRLLETRNPANGQVLGEIEAAGVDAIDAAVAAARRAFTSWSNLAGAERRRILLGYADALAAHVDELARLEALEVGRPLADAAMLIGQAPTMLRRYVEMADYARGDLISAESRQLGISWRRPRGVIGAIVPWNFPVMNVLIRLGPALATGNAIVVKPSEHAPRSAVAMARIATRAGLPEGVFNVVIGTGGDAGQRLAAHRDVDLVTFTGSTQTGLAVSRAAAAETLKPLLLECGGKSPQIVLDDAFDDPAIWHPIFFSAFWNSGQWCAAKTRLLVPRARINRALAGLQSAAATWRLGDPFERETRLGPLVNADQRDRVLGFCEEAGRLGSVIELECPRGPADAGGYFVTPAVAVGQPRGSSVTREEVFGPLLSLEPFDDVDDAVALANASDYGLMASIWTNRADQGHRLARELVAGGITICSSAEAAMASAPDIIGAYLEPQKQSGYGIDGGLPGLMAYTTAQSVSWLN